MLIIGTFDKDGRANAMNAAWGGQWDNSEIMISMGSHATTENLNERGEFTVAFATKGTLVASDYVDAVMESLCFGWIDSTLKKVDEGCPLQRFSPRRKGSHWTELNRERCRQMIAEGRMTEFGLEEYNKSYEQETKQNRTVQAGQ